MKEEIVEMTEVKREESEVEWGWRSEGGSWFQWHGEAYRKERSVIRREDDVGGRARVTGDEERVTCIWMMIDHNVQPSNDVTAAELCLIILNCH